MREESRGKCNKTKGDTSTKKKEKKVSKEEKMSSLVQFSSFKTSTRDEYS